MNCPSMRVGRYLLPRTWRLTIEASHSEQFLEEATIRGSVEIGL
jgi:hypothetical protein